RSRHRRVRCHARAANGSGLRGGPLRIGPRARLVCSRRCRVPSGASPLAAARAMRRALAVALLAASACSAGDPGATRVAVNWKPEPEFGGLDEAVRSGGFARHGVGVEITGGPGAPVVQMIDSGQVEFGVVSADEVLVARDRGVDLVAVFATY